MVNNWNDRQQVIDEAMRLSRSVNLPGKFAVAKYPDRENYNIIFSSNAEKAKEKGAEIVLTV